MEYCPSCGFTGLLAEMQYGGGEEFRNCPRCGYFHQIMLRSKISDEEMEILLQSYLNHTITKKYVTIRGGGKGTYVVERYDRIDEGNFEDYIHINNFIASIDERIQDPDVLSITYTINVSGVGWKTYIRRK